MDPNESDCSYDPHADIDNDTDAKMEQFVEDWALSLDCDDVISLGLFLSYHLNKTLNVPKTKAAEFSSMMLGKSDRTIRLWRADFLQHGTIPDNK